MRLTKQQVGWLIAVSLVSLLALAVLPGVDSLSTKAAIEKTGAKAYGPFFCGADLREMPEAYGSEFDPSKTLLQLSQIRSLYALNLTGVTIDTKLLLGFHDLLTLSLSHTYIKDSSLEDIVQLTKLESFSISWCTNLTSQGLLHLKGMPNLEWLSLPPIKDTPESRRILADLIRSLPKLHEVYLPEIEGQTAFSQYFAKSFPEISWTFEKINWHFE